MTERDDDEMAGIPDPPGPGVASRPGSPLPPPMRVGRDLPPPGGIAASHAEPAPGEAAAIDLAPVVVAVDPVRPLPDVSLPVGSRLPAPSLTDADALSPAVRSLLDADRTGVIVLDRDGNLRSVNRTMLSLLDASSLDDLDHGAPAGTLLRSFLDQLPQQLLENGDGGIWQGDLDHRGPDNEPLLYRATACVIANGSPGTGRVGLLVHDVTAARRALAELRHLASHDPLTGLANRGRILQLLAQAIADQREERGHVAAIFIDLDHLKYVNDAFGHRAGDQLITSTAQRLAAAVRPEDRVARIGGDEFLVVNSAIPDAVTALDVAERARRALTGHLRIGDLDLEFSVSVGIALSDAELLDLPDVEAANALVSNADTAMYEAKRTGRGRCVLFTSHMRTASRERTELAAALARAVQEEDLTVEYQPVFSTVDHTATGAEALLRWIHPSRGRMDPRTFIEIAEESGVIGRLGEQVLDRALVDLAGWREAGTVGDDFAVHVNVSRVQLGAASFVNFVIDRLRRHRIRPEQLVLEARETSLLGRESDVDRSIRALRRHGVQIAVDNFGTGPKALAVMTDVGADMLKLDGSLALPSGSSESDSRLVRAIVLLAHALDMEVVAERVSGIEQLGRLRAAGCDLVQGNLLGHPVRADRFSPTIHHPW